jgi:two-component system, NarL family, nitrate/nitrite response regulator NarL
MFEQELRLFIVAEDPLVRAGLAALLAEQPGCVLVGQAAGGEETAVLLHGYGPDSYRPDVIIWDIGWTTEPDLAWLSDWFERLPALLVLLDEADAVPELWAAGARGLLWRNATAEQMVAAAQAVNQGLAVLDTDLVNKLLPDEETLVAAASLESLSEPLTPREHEVLQLLAEGLTNKAIAQQLAVSEHTVKFHVTAIMSKLDAQSRTEAVVRATRLGLFIL